MEPARPRRDCRGAAQRRRVRDGLDGDDTGAGSDARGLAIPATTYIDALRYRGVALREFRARVFESVDVLALPCLTLPTPTIAETDVGGSPRIDSMIATLVTYLRPISFLGLPSLSIPVGFHASGLPIGMQLVGRPFDEVGILKAGRAFQAETDWHRRLPPIS